MAEHVSESMEEAILRQMEEESGAEVAETEEELLPDESQKIIEGTAEEIPLKPMSKKSVKLMLEQIKDVKFKFGEAIFRVKAVNPGKGTFSARIENEVLDPKTKDIIGINRAKGSDAQ